MDVELQQRGRASNNFLATLAGFGGALSQQIEKDFKDLGLATAFLDGEAETCSEDLVSALRQSNAFQVEALINEWLSVNHGLVAIDAFHEIKPHLESELRQQLIGCCDLVLDPDCEIPDYWQNVEIHRTTGGWNGHPDMGFIHSEIIHKGYVAAKYPTEIYRQRNQVLDCLPENFSCSSVFEMGCGTGHYTYALAKRFPDARVWGCDLSATLLQQAQRLANAEQWPWKLIQAPAEKTGLDSGQFDLVTSYILLHELPATAVEGVLKEAFRLLKPGGRVLMSDVRPLWDMDKYLQWRSIHRAQHGGEPYWEEATSLDLNTLLASIGYCESESFGLGAAKYPWVTIGVKPE